MNLRRLTLERRDSAVGCVLMQAAAALIQLRAVRRDIERLRAGAAEARHVAAQVATSAAAQKPLTRH